MNPEIYAAVLSFLGQPAPPQAAAPPERSSSSKARAFRIARARDERTKEEAPVEDNENESLRVALEQREIVTRAASKSWGYLRHQARMNSNAVPFSDPIQGGDPLMSAVALKWMVSSDEKLRDRLLGQLPQQLIPASRPVTQDQLDRAVHWLMAFWRSGRLSIPKLREYGGQLLKLVQESGTSSKSPAWDVGVSAHLLEPILLAARYGSSDAPDEAVQALLRQVEQHLISQKYLDGSHFYPLPEVFLCQVSEVWRQTTPLSASLRKPLEAAVRDRWWSSAGPVREPLHRRALALAALIIAAENLHLSEVNLNRARQELSRLQSVEGAFSPSPYRRLHGSYLGTRVTTTMFAVRALEGQPRTGGWGPGRQWSAGGCAG